MPIPQSLPVRRIDLDTGNPDDIAAVQPERQRTLVQLESGELRFRMRELVWGGAAIQSERWSCGIRVHQDRPSSHVTFAFATQARARWMGAPIGAGSVLRIVEPWDCVSEGAFEYVAFAVSRSAFESASLLVCDPDRHAMPTQNRVGRRPDAMLLALRLLGDLHSLERCYSHPAALAAAGDDLLQLALLLDRPRNLVPVERLSSSSGRLVTVRRVEAYLEACGGDPSSIPTLCRITGVSERTLEYAFREHLGVTPVKYLKLRRLMQARRRLQNPDSHGGSVTEIVAGCGIYELGRFSGEYRMLFGELPSETLARSSRSGSRGTSIAAMPTNLAVPPVALTRTRVDQSHSITPLQSASTALPSAQPTL